MMAEMFQKMEDKDASTQVLHDELVAEIARMLNTTASIMHHAIYRASIDAGRPLDVAHVVYNVLAHHKEKADGRAEDEG